ncbi:MAG: YeeE/YedE family protein [Chromatiales bacterium]|nr:YeeE/YedE family protein [Chromatiales bacterium]
MENFTPFSALAGGLMIGSAALLLLALSGRIAGVSGIVNGAIENPGSDRTWRLAFVLGLVAGGSLYLLVWPQGVTVREGFPTGWLIAAGLLVGFGTRLGSGCTSGHGVCGIGRLSPRSLVATLTFMVAGVLSTAVTRHLLGVGQ